MENEAVKPWRYSHTQLALWKLCKRKYYQAYILRNKEPKTANMAAGTWLAQEPIEGWERDQRINFNAWESIWANFLAEFGGDDSYDDPIFTINLAKQVLNTYKKNPVQGKVMEIEHTYEKEFPGGYLYTSRPDLVTEIQRFEYNEGIAVAISSDSRTTWDIKLKTFNQARAGDTWFASAPLSPFDDQCLGQAVCAGADAFGQIQFFVGKKDGLLLGPVYVEQPVNPVLAREWEEETKCQCAEIDYRRNMVADYPWRGPELFYKDDRSCHAFGKDCHCLANCNFGFEVKNDLSAQNQS